MDFKYNDLKEKINLYFDREISKEELSTWAGKAYLDLLKGGYVVTEKIINYYFLRIISTYNLPINDIKDEYPCSQEDIETIRNIVNGKENFVYTINIRFPSQIYKMFTENKYLDEKKLNHYVELRNLINKYITTKYLSSDEIEQCVEYLNIDIRETHTLLNILEVFIQGLLKNNIGYINKNFELCPKMALYTKQSADNLPIKKLLAYLNCYVGNQDFSICIAFIDGNPQITILI